MRQIVRKESYIGLYRAYGATILAFAPFLGISLSLYEKLKELFKLEKNIKFYQAFSIALITGVVASVVTNPLEVPKLRM